MTNSIEHQSQAREPKAAPKTVLPPARPVVPQGRVVPPPTVAAQGRLVPPPILVPPPARPKLVPTPPMVPPDPSLLVQAPPEKRARVLESLRRVAAMHSEAWLSQARSAPIKRE